MMFRIFLTIAIMYNTHRRLVSGRGSVFEPRFYNCNGTKRIEYEEFCDGIMDCSDGEDDFATTESNITFDPLGEWHRCNNPKNYYSGFCLVPRDDVCNGIVTCSNLSPCDLKCDNHYKCQNGLCFRRTTICDQDPCSGCNEDHGWTNGAGFKCSRNGRECVLPQQLLHDDVSDCDGGADLCFRNLTALSRNERQPGVNLLHKKCFQCLDQSMIISISNVCDGIIQCPDLSDECACESGIPEICSQIVKSKNIEVLLQESNFGSGDGNVTTDQCQIGDVRCNNGTCIPREFVCDGIKNCDEDEKFDICGGTVSCKDATTKEECRCALDTDDVTCRAYSGTACDSIPDCPPLQIHGWIIDTAWTNPEDECTASCTEHPSNFTCVKTGSIHRKESLYGTWCDIPDDIEIPYAYTQAIDGEFYCDGIIDCELSGSDETDCVDDYYRYSCNATRPGYVSIKKEQVCDGFIDCEGGLDERNDSCIDQKRQHRFTCPVLGGVMVSIDMSNRCDFIINCDDSSDETNCSTSERFYCENEQPPLFVRRSKVKDGIGDCTDWSDECPTVNDSTKQNAFSSRYEMLDNLLLRIIVWIMAFLAITGNIAVIYHEIGKLRRLKSKITPAMRANMVLIVNLAISDFLMGVYLFAIAAMTVKVKGKYCSQDLSWRSGTMCVGLGILSVISSETSVVTMVMLTGCRLYSVLKPLESALQPSIRRVTFLVALSWAISLVLALLPLAPQLAHFFIAEVTFTHNPFATEVSVSLQRAKDMFRKLSDLAVLNDSIPNTGLVLQGATWTDLENAGSKLFSVNYFQPKKYWGYYSTASVCIPKFFIATSDPAWIFSFIVNIFNFLAFIFVAASYIGIYFKSKIHANLGLVLKNEERQMKSMQRKVLRLIITDFCCWIPICVMAFAKLAGVDISTTAYAVAAIVLLPLNSALNPVLYSDMLDAICRKIHGEEMTSSSSSQRTGRHSSSRSFQLTRLKISGKRGSSLNGRKRQDTEKYKAGDEERSRPANGDRNSTGEEHQAEAVVEDTRL